MGSEVGIRLANELGLPHAYVVAAWRSSVSNPTRSSRSSG